MLLVDEKAAVAIERGNRAQHSADEIESILDDLHEQHKTDPENVDLSRKIAERYEEKASLDEAVRWYDYAAALTGNSDATLVRKASDLRLKMYDAVIGDLSRRIGEDPDSEEAQRIRQELEDVRKSRDSFRLEEAKSRVERNPTDLLLRYELGEILMEIGSYREAISELQKARHNPSTRLRAMCLLGRCYALRRMYDFAEKTLLEAANELSQMDDVKKEIVYQLGLVREQMGHKAQSVECMKLIYEVDCDYLDVANRVEGAYDEVL
jgi:tetratricopeptide (TPR) repeat protein